LRNLLRRLERLERSAPRNAESRLSVIAARAAQIAEDRSQKFADAIFPAIQHLGTALIISDVDSILIQASQCPV
jgi:hypothetical protein